VVLGYEIIEDFHMSAKGSTYEDRAPIGSVAHVGIEALVNQELEQLEVVALGCKKESIRFPLHLMDGGAVVKKITDLA
jgi:hypothetical protein